MSVAACKMLGALASSCDTRNVKDYPDSLYSRARSAPQLMATWGPAHFLIFYASKSLDDIDSRRAEFLWRAWKSVMMGRDREEVKGFVACEIVSKISDTSMGYLLYTLALSEAIVRLMEREQNFGRLDELFDFVIRLYVKPEEGKELGAPSVGTLNLLVQTLSRLIETKVLPIVNTRGTDAKIEYMIQNCW
ncbi:hypothetical protein IPA_02400 [Ignicoccus pacificus DSM 13166]|uniref:Uncharacterized protein n=1 Tax=Ignicoccus pacificus DSM 13166 TaxID=940294 RepID=A0A977PL69_9CREN|nr:hypothetical protein IPA_02400 [Ignicoccus pacificus DSM 13166]